MYIYTNKSCIHSCIGFIISQAHCVSNGQAKATVHSSDEQSSKSFFAQKSSSNFNEFSSL